MDKDVKKALEGLEACAKHGRAAWELLWTKLESSDEKDEIGQFLAEWVADEEY